jgi:hypothetical protein
LLCIICSIYSVFIVPPGTLQLPWLRFVRAFSSVVRQMPGYNSQREGTARTLPKLIVLFYVLFLCKRVRTVLLPPCVNPVAVNKCIYNFLYLLWKVIKRSGLFVKRCIERWFPWVRRRVCFSYTEDQQPSLRTGRVLSSPAGTLVNRVGTSLWLLDL